MNACSPHTLRWGLPLLAFATRRHGGPGSRWGPPFGPGGGPPPWLRGMGFPPFGGPESTRRGRGDVRLAVLGLLAEQSMHGYQLIREIAARSAGGWRVSPGSVYPMLSQLEESGLVESVEADGRRSFALTESGRAEAARRSEEFTALWQRAQDDADDGRGELAGLVFQVGAAAMQVGAAGTEEQRERAADLLEQTRRSLYRLLANDDPEGGEKQ